MVAAFDGGLVTSDAGALLLASADRAIRLVERFAACFRDGRDPDLIEHSIAAMVGQRVFGLAFGCEDLNDHDDLRRDPVLGVVLGQAVNGTKGPVPLAGKSTLNRLEHAPSGAFNTRYHKNRHDGAAIESLFVDLFLETHGYQAPREIVLDIDMPPTTRCTATRRVASSTATTLATVTCSSTSSVADTFSPPG